MNEVQVEDPTGITYYSLETPRGNRFSFDEDELSEDYIEEQLWAWSRLLDFVKERQDA